MVPDFYTLAMDTFGALFGAVAALRTRGLIPPLDQPPPILQLRRGLAESPAWFMVQAAEFDPEPLSVARLRVRDVYASPQIVQALLDLMASEGWFEISHGEEYSLTAAGRAVMQRLIETPRAALATLEPHLDWDPTPLEHLLRRLIDVSGQSDTPPGTWCLAYSRRRAPAEDAPALVKIAQYFADFNAFRDDAHMAAWQPYQISGHAWEAFSHVWSGEAHTAAQLGTTLAYRGYTPAAYGRALDDLVRRGWLQAHPDARYTLTPLGSELREEVERRTNAYFYTPWGTLAASERAEVHTHLIQLGEQLRRISASESPSP